MAMAAGVLGTLLGSVALAEQTETNTMSSLYDIAVTQIDGTATNLGGYKGQVMLIVNVASRCGFTGQYAGLQKLYETYKDRGLVVMGFPANDFLRQEPGTNPEIAQFCSAKFHVTFPMFEKIAVTGSDQHPLYRYLTDKATNPQFEGKITWNFNKFLIDREGRIVARFNSRVEPEHKEVIAAIEKALGAKQVDQEAGAPAPAPLTPKENTEP
jgi:glutathione peroxidase